MENSILENKKEDKRQLKKFLIILLVAFFVGMIFGFCASFLDGNPADIIAKTVYMMMEYVVAYGIPILVILCWIVFIPLYAKCKKVYKAWDGEEEETIDKVEIWLSYLMLASSVCMIGVFFLYACSMTMMLGGIKQLIITGAFVLGMATVIIQQHLEVKMEKDINPEKKGSVFDTKFQKKWEESCDEAEKLMIYKSSHAAYKAVSTTCLVLWVFCAIGSTIWNFGILPVTMVTIIWFVMMLTYIITGIKLYKESKKGTTQKEVV